MHVLIVQTNSELALLWQRQLEHLGADVVLVQDAAQASDQIETTPFDVVVLDLVLAHGSGLALADLVHLQQPRANVVFVTDTTIFSDGSIFSHSPNARILIKTATPPKDLAAIVFHYGSTRPVRAAHHSWAEG